MKKKYIAAGIGGAIGAVIAWKFATRAETVQWEQAAGDMHHADRSAFAEVDGLRVHYQEFGEPTAPVMLLIDGYSASTFTWKKRRADAGRRRFPRHRGRYDRFWFFHQTGLV